jgi:type I restriction enzyme, S subunit
VSVPAGYKATEVGVIPEDWDVRIIREILHLRRGRVISHGEIGRNAGVYPVYSSQTKNNGVMGYLSSYEFDGDYLSWTTDGANAGTVFFRQGKFNCTNVCGTGRSISPEETFVEFFAYYLNTVAKNYVSYVGNPKLMSGIFGIIPVLVPGTA